MRAEWSGDELRALRDMAGDFPASAIAECLGRSQSAVRVQASRMGLSLKCDKAGLHWCSECMTWRTSEDCPVCHLRDLTERAEERCRQLGYSKPFSRDVLAPHEHDTGDWLADEDADIRAWRRAWDRARSILRRLT